MLQADVNVTRAALDRANAELTSLGSEKARLTVELLSAQRMLEARWGEAISPYVLLVSHTQSFIIHTSYHSSFNPYHSSITPYHSSVTPNHFIGHT